MVNDNCLILKRQKEWQRQKKDIYADLGATLIGGDNKAVLV